MVEKEDKDFVLKDQVSLKFTSRPHETKVKFSKWYAAQNNVQNSMLSIVEHMIDRFGNVDVCDHEIAKKLYTEMIHFNGNSVSLETHKEVPIIDSFEPVKSIEAGEILTQTKTSNANIKSIDNQNEQIDTSKY